MRALTTSAVLASSMCFSSRHVSKSVLPCMFDPGRSPGRLNLELTEESRYDRQEQTGVLSLCLARSSIMVAELRIGTHHSQLGGWEVGHVESRALSCFFSLVVFVVFCLCVITHTSIQVLN